MQAKQDNKLDLLPTVDDISHSFDKITSFENRTFVLLQGPQSSFYSKLTDKLVSLGSRVIKVNFCGGDVFLWTIECKNNDRVKTVNYHGRACDFTAFITDIFTKEKADDLVLYSDWRPMHQDAILIAKFNKIRVWVFEEGYLRKGFVTLERNGVNGRSSLPKTSYKVRELASNYKPFKESSFHVDSIREKVLFAIKHHVGNTLLFPLFCHYRTHREHNIFFELIGILPRYLTRKRRIAKSRAALRDFFKVKNPYFFYPLQLNSDSQVQLYSPYVRQEEAITTVISSFAKYAPSNTRLLIKNHPLDNGLIPYRRFINSIATSLGVASRVCFIEDANTNFLVHHSKAVVLINSTVGLSALLERKNVFCLGYSIYSMDGLAKCILKDRLDDFWTTDDIVDEKLLNDYCKVLLKKALIEGDFYTKSGVELAISGVIKRFMEC